MLTQCPELQSCGALYPVWLNGLKMLRIIDLKIPYTAYVYQFKIEITISNIYVHK